MHLFSLWLSRYLILFKDASSLFAELVVSSISPVISETCLNKDICMITRHYWDYIFSYRLKTVWTFLSILWRDTPGVFGFTPRELQQRWTSIPICLEEEEHRGDWSVTTSFVKKWASCGRFILFMCHLVQVLWWCIWHEYDELALFPGWDRGLPSALCATGQLCSLQPFLHTQPLWQSIFTDLPTIQSAPIICTLWAENVMMSHPWGDIKRAIIVEL